MQPLTLLAAGTVLLAAVSGPHPPARAQDASTVTGDYCLVGVREVGSCFRLSPGGKFQYFLAYGAYDETSEGTWRLDKGEIVIDSLPYDRRPVFAFRRTERGTGDGFDIVVVSKAGRAITGIDVRATCDGRSIRVGVTGAGGYKVDCARAPVDVSLGLAMYGLAFQRIDVADKAGADKTYVFEFDPGDLGHKRFLAHRLTIGDGNSLLMIYSDTPIGELSGRTFRFARQ